MAYLGYVVSCLVMLMLLTVFLRRRQAANRERMRYQGTVWDREKTDLTTEAIEEIVRHATQQQRR